MEVLEIPFNRFVKLKYSTDLEYLLMLENSEEYHNHLGTVHASALFALAEATSGYFLLNEFQQVTNIIPVVRRVETKFKKPATGAIFSKASFVDAVPQQIIIELNTSQRVLITVRISLYDSERKIVMQSDFEWFIAKKQMI
jgi:acyl-coenzyme A thioesterase PaaI-like protein